MKDFVERNYRFTHWANTAVCDAIAQLPVESPQRTKALTLLGHILAASALWRARILGEDVRGRNVWPTSSLDELRAMAAAEHEAWTTYLASLAEADLLTKIEYPTLKGDPFMNSTRDILHHVVNHSSYHRAQIATLIREAGGTPTPTDYIAFARKFPDGE